MASLVALGVAGKVLAGIAAASIQTVVVQQLARNIEAGISHLPEIFSQTHRRIQERIGPREEIAFHRWYFHNSRETSSTIHPRLSAFLALIQDSAKLCVEATAWLVNRVAQKLFNYKPVHSLEKREQIISEFFKCLKLDLTAIFSPSKAKEKAQISTYTWGMRYEGVRDTKWKFESSQYNWTS